MANGLSRCYRLEESTFILKDIRSDFEFLSHYSMKFHLANRIGSAVSHLGLYCLLCPINRKPGLSELMSRKLWLCANMTDICCLGH